ncbi:MAG: hypothetical protein ACYC5X_16335 [Syntrophales bacterium]
MGEFLVVDLVAILFSFLFLISLVKRLVHLGRKESDKHFNRVGGSTPSAIRNKMVVDRL